MSRAGLTKEQNDLIRAHIREYLERTGESQENVGKKIGFTQPGLSSFLTGRAGTNYPTVERLAKLLRVPEWDLVGKPPPRMPLLPPRELAATLARQIHVSEAAIAEVLAEPLTPETEQWPALYWTDQMRRRDLELMARGREPPPHPANGGAQGLADLVRQKRP